MQPAHTSPLTGDPLNDDWSRGWGAEPCEVVALERARAREPRFDEVMKWYDTEYRYLRCNLMICTIPQSVANLQVFGATFRIVFADAVATWPRAANAGREASGTSAAGLLGPLRRSCRRRRPALPARRRRAPPRSR
jgi:hypothetical protein